MTQPMVRPRTQPLSSINSIKVKLGLLVVASVVVASAVASLARAAGVPAVLSIPVTTALALAVTQLLAVGMTSPLRQMTRAARQMATGDYDVRVPETSADEVGELARAFNRMARDLAEVDRQRRELVANVSHELRTPLAALCAVLENVVDGVEPRDPQSVATALEQAERLGRLVEDLLDLARVDAGHVPLNPAPVRLDALLEAAVEQARMLGREVAYDVTVTPQELTVEADAARLHQLMANLLDNASRHSPREGRVTVIATRAEGRLRLEVHDQGPGVAAPDRERVFEPFGTLRGTDGGGGTGLGLAIARWVTELHRGAIYFVDPPPAHTGGRVRVELPLDASTAPSITQEKPMPVVPPPVEPHPGPHPPPRPTPGIVPEKPLLDEVFGGFWPEAGVPGRVGLLLAAVATGVLAGAALPFNDLGLGTFLVLGASGGVLFAASSRRRDPFTLACAGLCLLLASTAVIRDADWILVLCLVAGAGLAVVGVTRARTSLGFVLAGVCWPLAGLRGLPWLGRTLAALTGLGRSAALLRTLALSTLALVVFGALFASADALVARWFDAALPDLTLDTLVLRAFVAVAVGGPLLAAAYLSLNPPGVDLHRRPGRPVERRFEWLAPVLVVNAVFATLLLAQATAFFGGADYLERTTGLTYSEYSRQGFGQLTFATGLTLLVIAVAARKAPRDTTGGRAWLRTSLGLLCLQTLVVVASALYRMHLYQEAYGFTRLRLLVDVFEGWLGLIVLAVLVAGVSLRAAWLPRFAVLSGVVALLGLAAINPDAWIARHNLDRYAETGRVDWSYLTGLSDDAVPVFVELPQQQRRCVLAGRDVSQDAPMEWNLARSRAADALSDTPLEEYPAGGGQCLNR